jgi:hypothetical protein
LGRRRGGMFRVRNKIMALQIEVGEGIKVRRQESKSTDPTVEVPLVGAGSSPPCVIDE